MCARGFLKGSERPEAGCLGEFSELERLGLGLGLMDSAFWGS